MAWGFKSGGRDFAVGYDPRRKTDHGVTQSRSKTRRDLINYYVAHCADALLDVLEMRGLIPQLVERYNTRERCIRPQGGGSRWRAARPRNRRATHDERDATTRTGRR